MSKDITPPPNQTSLQPPEKPAPAQPVHVAQEVHKQMAESLQHLLAPPKAHFRDPEPPMLDLEPLTAHLAELTEQTEAALNRGTRMPLEENLTTQARMLDAVFQKLVHQMAHRGFSDNTLRTTLNAQRQYRYTVETLRKAPSKYTPNELNKLEMQKIDRLVIDHVSAPE